MTHFLVLGWYTSDILYEKFIFLWLFHFPTFYYLVRIFNMFVFFDFTPIFIDFSIWSSVLNNSLHSFLESIKFSWMSSSVVLSEFVHLLIIVNLLYPLFLLTWFSPFTFIGVSINIKNYKRLSLSILLICFLFFPISSRLVVVVGVTEQNRVKHHYIVLWS